MEELRVAVVGIVLATGGDDRAASPRESEQLRDHGTIPEHGSVGASGDTGGGGGGPRTNAHHEFEMSVTLGERSWKVRRVLAAGARVPNNDIDTPSRSDVSPISPLDGARRRDRDEPSLLPARIPDAPATAWQHRPPSETTKMAPASHPTTPPPR
jgi:hypothetical protein